MSKIVYLKTEKVFAESEEVGPFRIDENGKVRLMAHDVLRVPSYVKIGHKNGNTYDNRRSNLFIIDPRGQENDRRLDNTFNSKCSCNSK